MPTAIELRELEDDELEIGQGRRVGPGVGREDQADAVGRLTCHRAEADAGRLGERREIGADAGPATSDDAASPPHDGDEVREQDEHDDDDRDVGHDSSYRRAMAPTALRSNCPIALPAA